MMTEVVIISELCHSAPPQPYPLHTATTSNVVLCSFATIAFSAAVQSITIIQDPIPNMSKKEKAISAVRQQENDEQLPDAPGNDSAAQPATHQTRKKTNQTILAQVTLQKPTWTYLHLALHSSPPSSQPMDPSTARLHLTSALKQFLGLTGEAIPIDFLKLEDRDLWIRVPRADGAAVVAALSGWVGGSEGATVGWRIKGKDDWLNRLSCGDGMDLFGG